MAAATAIMKGACNLAAGLRFRQDETGAGIAPPILPGRSPHAAHSGAARAGRTAGVGGRDETNWSGARRRIPVPAPGMAAAWRMTTSGRLPIAVGQETIAHEI